MLTFKKEENNMSEIENNTERVQIEMSSEILTVLLSSGLLHCGDCKCLNAHAKSVLWHTLLANSASVEQQSITKDRRGKMLCA